ncbi:MAG: phosphotransferase, partial [Candidatus Hydrogenedentes bacterium]|nr:phosphotransferase [Candidatus Hydrogenedentota bacterium]
MSRMYLTLAALATQAQAISDVRHIPRAGELLDAWEVGDLVSAEPLVSYSGGAKAVTMASGVRYALKLRKVKGNTELELDLVTALDAAGVPVAIPVKTKSGAPYLVLDSGIYGLYPWLRGRVIVDHYSGDALGRARRFGRAIARLHTALRDWRAPVNVPVYDLLAEARARHLPALNEYPEDVDCARVAAIAEACFAGLEPLGPDLPIQWIHGDIHPENMLFDKGELTGIVDFDMVRRCFRVYDPCYCARSMLFDGWEDPANRAAWPGIFRELIAGYEETIPLAPAERRGVVP